MIETLSDDEIDELIAGHTPEGLYELRSVAAVADAVRQETAKEQVPVSDYALRLALLRVAEARAGRGTASTAQRRREAPIAVPSHRRRLIQLAAACVALGALASASAANALPTPIQNVVAEAGDLIGIDVPQPEEDEPVTTSDGTVDDDATRDDDGSDGDGSATDGGSNGAEAGSHAPKDTSASGATPADPGTPGDHEPATPAVPPERSNGGNENGTGPGSGNGQGHANGQDNGNGRAKGNENGADASDDEDESE